MLKSLGAIVGPWNERRGQLQRLCYDLLPWPQRILERVNASIGGKFKGVSVLLAGTYRYDPGPLYGWTVSRRRSLQEVVAIWPTFAYPVS